MASIRQHATRLFVPLIRARALALDQLARQYATEYDKEEPDGELLDGIDNLLQIELSGLELILVAKPNERDELGKPMQYGLKGKLYHE